MVCNEHLRLSLLDPVGLDLFPYLPDNISLLVLEWDLVLNILRNKVNNNKDLQVRVDYRTCHNNIWDLNILLRVDLNNINNLNNRIRR